MAEPGQRIYSTQAGDYWDLVSFRVYGSKIGSEMYMDQLISSNYDLRKMWRFPAGWKVVIPILPAREEKPLIPWTTIVNT